MISCGRNYSIWSGWRFFQDKFALGNVITFSQMSKKLFKHSCFHVEGRLILDDKMWRNLISLWNVYNLTKELLKHSSFHVRAMLSELAIFTPKDFPFPLLIVQATRAQMICQILKHLDIFATYKIFSLLWHSKRKLDLWIYSHFYSQQQFGEGVELLYFAFTYHIHTCMLTNVIAR